MTFLIGGFRLTNFGDFRLTVFGQFNPTLTAWHRHGIAAESLQKIKEKNIWLSYTCIHFFLFS